MIPAVFPLCAWLWVTGTPAVTLADLERFPAEYVARGQRELCQRHLERLKRWKHVHGATPRIERWERETRAHLGYWHLLEQAHDNWTGGVSGQLFWLRRLHDRITRPAYLSGWHPEVWEEPEP